MEQYTPIGPSKEEHQELTEQMANMQTTGITIAPSGNIENIQCFKIGNIVMMNIRTGTISLASGDTLMQLPSELTPVAPPICCLFDYSNGNIINGSLWIYSSRNVIYYGTAISSKKLQFTLMYAI